MSNIDLIVPISVRNTCYYTYIIYLGIKINSPNPTRPRKKTAAETAALKAVSSFGNGKQQYSFWVWRMTSNECYVC